MTSTVEEITEDIKNNLSQQMVEGTPLTIKFSYAPSSHITLPVESKGSLEITLNYDDYEHYLKVEDKLDTIVTDMFLRMLNENKSVVQKMNHKKLFKGKVIVMRIKYMPNPADRRSYVRFGRLELFVDFNAERKLGYKYDRETETNPLFAYAVASDKPHMFGIVMKSKGGK